MNTTAAVLDEIRDELLKLDEPARRKFLRGCLPRDRRIISAALARARLLKHQVPPPGGWKTWLLLAGRGAGKTYAAARDFDDHMSGPPCDPTIPGGHQAIIVGPSLGDVWNSCVKGPSGLEVANPHVRAGSGPGGLHVVWPSGAVARTGSAYGPRDVESLRSKGNNCRVWAEELAAWPRLEDAWDQLQFGLRIGPDPRSVASTTPKARPLIRKLVKDRRVAISKASTRQNPYLSADVREALYERYAGTTLGRQELDAELLDEVEGALWRYNMIRRWEGSWSENDAGLLVPDLPELKRVGVGVDPPGGTTECGIVTCAVDGNKTAFVLDDRSIAASPGVWARRAVSAAEQWDADAIVAEVNYGGDMVKHTIAGADPDVPVREVRATRGKTLRAEPIVLAYEKGRVYHVGIFPELETEMTTWVDESGVPSPNRIDALVWSLWWLIVGRPHKRARGAVDQIVGARIDPGL